MLFPMVIILTVIEEGYCNFGPRGSAIHMKVGWGQVILFLDKNYFGKLFSFSVFARGVVKCFTDRALCRQLPSHTRTMF